MIDAGAASGVDEPVRAAPSAPSPDGQPCFAPYTATNSVVRAYRLMLDRMETNGLLVRIRDDVDRRLVHVVLTATGHRLEPVAAVQRDVACRTTRSRDEETAIRTALRGLVDRMDEAGAS